jgi:two-component system sensor histidine kinase VanS
MIILLASLGGLSIFFADQIRGAIESTQTHYFETIFEPFLEEIQEKSESETIALVKDFHERNESFDFAYISKYNEILYITGDMTIPSTEPTELQPQHPGSLPFDNTDETSNMLGKIRGKMSRGFSFVTFTGDGSRILVYGKIDNSVVYNAFLKRAISAFLIMFAICLVAAIFFSRRISKPILVIATDTKKMSELKPMKAPKPRSDEIGDLADDVYKMYLNLKKTVSRLEQEIKKEREMEMNQRYFFTAASHELKSPVAAQSAMIEGMLDGIVDESEYEEYLSKCLTSTREQAKLISEILEIVSLNSDTYSPAREKIVMSEFVRDAAAGYEALALSKSQAIDTRVPEGLSVFADKKLLERAVSNVIINGIQNSPAGSRIHIYAETKEKQVVLGILNEGVNIPDEMLPKIFDPFFRADEARSREDGSSGLGLTIVKRTLDLMGLGFSLTNAENGVLVQIFFKV